MLKKIACAVAVLAISLGFAMAEEIKGKISKIEGGKVTIEEKGGAAKDYDLAKDVKVFKMTGKDTKEEVATGITGLKTPAGGKIVTNADGKVTEIYLIGKKK